MGFHHGEAKVCSYVAPVPLQFEVAKLQQGNSGEAGQPVATCMQPSQAGAELQAIETVAGIVAQAEALQGWQQLQTCTCA